MTEMILSQIDLICEADGKKKKQAELRTYKKNKNQDSFILSATLYDREDTIQNNVYSFSRAKRMPPPQILTFKKVQNTYRRELRKLRTSVLRSVLVSQVYGNKLPKQGGLKRVIILSHFQRLEV